MRRPTPAFISQHLLLILIALGAALIYFWRLGDTPMFVAETRRTSR